MCPDKPPSCYPTPTLRESRPERFDSSCIEAVGQRRANCCRPRATFSLRLADRNCEDRMSSQQGTRPRPVGEAMDYTVESANRLAAELRAIPAERSGQAEARQAGDGEAARGRDHRPPATRLHDRRGGREPARSRPRLSRRRRSRTTSSAPRARRRSERRTGLADRVRRARQRGAKGGEARGAERARARR